MASDEHDRPNNDTEQAASPPDDKDAIGEQRGDEQEVISAEPAEVESDDDDDEDAEPRFKYANLTSHLGPVFRNGDSASASLVSGDKLIIGTHAGVVHVLALPSLRPVKSSRVHDASITSISVSPYSQIFSSNQRAASDKDEGGRPVAQRNTGSVKGSGWTVPATPSNMIYIATSSIDGWVCVWSLVDPKDYSKRNFKRPVQSVALSPEFKYDRSYVSGGLAGELVHTSGIPAGAKVDANTGGATAAASSWLGGIGLGANTGKDSIKATGEGAISAIGWSPSGKYVAWVNEEGIKIARSNLFLHPDYATSAWTKIGHLQRPDRKEWEGMSSVWKAKLQWINDKAFDSFHDDHPVSSAPQDGKPESPQVPGSPASTPKKSTKRNHEQLLVGWGDTVWLIEIDPKGQHLKKPGQSPALGLPQSIHRFQLDDAVIAGLSMFTATAFLAITYPSSGNKRKSQNEAASANQKTGIKKRQNGQPIEMRLISLESGEVGEELDLEVLKVRRFETLSAADYHLSTLHFAKPSKASSKQRNALGQLSDGLWDVGVNATNATTRLFSSSASVLSGSSDDRTSVSTAQGTIRSVQAADVQSAFPSAYSKPGLKIFLMSPFDCFMGVKRDKADHLKHLIDTEKYQDAWRLLEAHPEAASRATDTDSQPSTPTQSNNTLLDFFDDSTSQSTDAAALPAGLDFAVKREKRRIGDLWIQQLIDRREWSKAGDIAEQALDTSHRWEHWISTFTKANKFDEIVSHIPKKRFRPPISATLYELVLGHYIREEPNRLKRLIEAWDTTVYDPSTVTSAIESRLTELSDNLGGDAAVSKDATWRLLQSCLADLLLADGRASDAVQCYVRAGDGEPAVQLVRENQLFLAIAEQIFSFVTVFITHDQLLKGDRKELDKLSQEPIFLLSAGTAQGLISVGNVIDQLTGHKPSADIFLFFFFRSLFNGDVDKQAEQPHVKRSRFAQLPTTNTTRILLTSYADLAVTLFAEFDPPLLNTLIRTNDASADADLSGGTLRFTFEHASAVCKARGLTSELVYLLALTGQTREALHLIADEMKDVPRAISFAREMDDRALWDDLLEYSLDKPTFIRGLLEEVGGGIGEGHDSDTNFIDPLLLVRRIPDGLQIQGLKSALTRILKDGEVQTSISDGAARVLRSEVAALLDQLTKARSRGVVFEVPASDQLDDAAGDLQPRNNHDSQPSPSQTCAICKNGHYSVSMAELITDPDSQDYLLGFPDGSIVHLECVLNKVKTPMNGARIRELRKRLEEGRADLTAEDAEWRRGKVGRKMTRAGFIRDIVGDFGGADFASSKEEHGEERAS